MRFMTVSAALAAAAMGWGVARAAGPAPALVSDPGGSQLEFTGVQEGAPFKGTFHRFTADVVFSPDDLPGAHIDVVIELASEDSGDKDRDGTIRGPDIFDVAHFSTAHYVTRSFSKTVTGYAAVGSLTLHGVTKDVPIAFKFAPAGTGGTLAGTAELKRLDFDVGHGDWKSTDEVADGVKIAFSLTLRPRP